MVLSPVQPCRPVNVMVLVTDGRLAKVFGTLFLAIPATAAAGSPSYGAIVARLEYSNFLYGAPPCATICGLVPSTCVDYGYFTDVSQAVFE